MWHNNVEILKYTKKQEKNSNLFIVFIITDNRYVAVDHRSYKDFGLRKNIYELLSINEKYACT